MSDKELEPIDTLHLRSVISILPAFSLAFVCGAVISASVIRVPYREKKKDELL